MNPVTNDLGQEVDSNTAVPAENAGPVLGLDADANRCGQLAVPLGRSVDSDESEILRCRTCGPTGGPFRAFYRELNPWEQIGVEVDRPLEDVEPETGSEAPWDPGAETTAVKALRHPATPTLEERLAHEVSHLPYRAWCRSCVAGRGRDVAHSRTVDRSEDAVPVVSFDYGYMGDEKRLANGTLMVSFSDLSGC